jgi:hypothetical protein
LLQCAKSNAADLLKENMELGLQLGLKILCESPPDHFKDLGKEWIDIITPQALKAVNSALAHEVQQLLGIFMPFYGTTLYGPLLCTSLYGYWAPPFLHLPPLLSLSHPPSTMTYIVMSDQLGNFDSKDFKEALEIAGEGDYCSKTHFKDTLMKALLKQKSQDTEKTLLEYLDKPLNSLQKYSQIKNKKHLGRGQ